MVEKKISDACQLNSRPLMRFVAIFFTLCFSSSHYLFAECLTLIKGPIKFDIETCMAIDPNKDFDQNPDAAFIKSMTAKDRANFLKTYRGSTLKGRVVFSAAIRAGLSNEKGALNGEQITLYIKSNPTLSCSTLNDKRISGEINEACCSGSANVPCLLGTSYVLEEPKIIGNVNSTSGDKKRTDLRKQSDYVEAVSLYKQKKYRQSTNLLAKMFEESKLDPQGLYILGLAYRKLDICIKAVEPLEKIVELNTQKKIWGDQIVYVRKANFLLARCYSKLNRPDKSTLLLNSYLIEPRTYRTELKESLINKDFSWINSNKDFKDYKEKAKEALRKGSSAKP